MTGHCSLSLGKVTLWLEHSIIGYGKVSTSRLTSTSRPFDFQKLIQTGYNNGDNHIL
jgi:hypothetical protein